MKNLNQNIIDIVQNSRTTTAAATATSGTGISVFLGYVPDILGIIATIVGITITILLWRKQKRKLDLEIAVLKKKAGEL